MSAHEQSLRPLGAVLNDARHYYEGSTWVGQVEVKNCDTSTSKMRGQLAVMRCDVNSRSPKYGCFHLPVGTTYISSSYSAKSDPSGKSWIGNAIRFLLS